MRTSKRLALLAIVVGIVVGIRAIATADLENQQRGGEAGVFSSKLDRLRLVVPRGWFATEQASYPGMLLWMMHGQPDAHMLLTAEPFTRQVYCSWPVSCRTSHDGLPSKLACALSAKLKSQHMRVGPIQAGPKDNEENGMPTVWVEYDDGKRYLRQAVALTEDRVVSLLLSAGSSDGRAAYARAFEQALRTLRPLTAEEQVPAGAPPDAGVPVAPVDGGPLPDAAPVPLAVPMPVQAAPSAPATKVNPVGACT